MAARDLLNSGESSYLHRGAAYQAGEYRTLLSCTILLNAVGVLQQC